MDSERWAEATAGAFDNLAREECAEVAKPEWWNDEGLKALSARVVRAAPDNGRANDMRGVVLRGVVLGGMDGAWQPGPRSPAELREAATHFERTAALCSAPEVKAALAGCAERCRRRADAM